MGEFIKEKLVKIRKDHMCFGCETLFKKGAMLTVRTCSDSGQILNDYFCAICIKIVDKWDDYDWESSTQGCVKDYNPELFKEQV
jgi:hypothetical protein